VKTVRGDQIIIDDMSVDDDNMDANWIMVAVMFSTNYLNARFRKKDANGLWVSEYKPSHVVDNTPSGGGVTEEQREIDNFHIFDAGKDGNPNNYGYNDRRTYDRAKRTKCWYCFDKVKRRFYLYTDTDWTWPVWVYNDPYNLPQFYPLFKLQYHTDPRTTRTKGEVSHYLDQQDDLNTIADELNRARTALRDKTLFDSSALNPNQVEDLLLAPGRKALGITLPDGKKWEDLIGSVPLPNLEHQHLWDRALPLAAMNQISGIGDAQRGEQFKTNTTNQAIEFYNSVSGVRLDEKRDSIEDFVGEIMNAVLFLCLQFMDTETFISIAGSQFAPQLSQLRPMMPGEIRNTIKMRIAGGSTQKPTSAAKKAEALQVGQILGQFAGATPYALILAMKMFARSFDGFTVTEKDWMMLLQTMMMGLQKAGAGPQGQQRPGPGQGEQPPKPNGQDKTTQQAPPTQPH
jgi:hypothetical protein